jgi:hypothetical protein
MMLITDRQELALLAILERRPTQSPETMSEIRGLYSRLRENDTARAKGMALRAGELSRQMGPGR